nr:hypothetical protein [Janibacter melonis]
MSHVVRRGDCLWDVAERHLGSRATPAEVVAALPHWYETNRSVIGDDPDLVLPGIVLHAPDPLPAAGGPRDEHAHPHRPRALGAAGRRPPHPRRGGPARPAHPYVQDALAVDFRMASDEAVFGIQPTPADELPDAQAWAAHVGQAVAEVMHGARPPAQVLRWTSPRSTPSSRAAALAARRRVTPSSGRRGGPPRPGPHRAGLPPARRRRRGQPRRARRRPTPRHGDMAGGP